MRIESLTKLVGSAVRLRPIPKRFEGQIECPQKDYYYWRTQKVDKAKREVGLLNVETWHSKPLGFDHVLDYRSDQAKNLVSVQPPAIMKEPYLGNADP